MRVELLLVRHGNTFGPGDAIVWVGKGQDLPLVESGRAQARRLRDALQASDWSPTAALSGGLKRQVEHLEIATGGTPEPSRVEALDEVDYGVWGGLSTEEIVERFGSEAVMGWNERSEWPKDADWPETREEVQARVRAFANAVADGEFGERVIACSSNGLLRWFLDLVPNGFEDAVVSNSFKVRTGNVCRLIAQRPNSTGDVDWSIDRWNLAPDELAAPEEDTP